MKAPLLRLGCAALLAGAAFGQSEERQPSFELADVHHSAHTNFEFLKGPYLHNGLYEMLTANMVDLVSGAYGVEPERVQGGPSWLEMERFDVIAKPPGKPTQESLRLMLRELLAERFKLVVHDGTSPMQVFTLSVGKGKPKLKESDGSGTPGCEGKNGNPQPGQIIYAEVSCHNESMEAFAQDVQQMAGAYITSPVVDSTGLEGHYDFDVKWSPRALLGQQGADGISIFDAVDRELGLKLELGKVSRPVIIVDRVNRTPTENVADVDAKLGVPPRPTEFEVADLKATPSDFQGRRLQLQPGGRVNIQGVTLKFLIEQVWNLSDEMLVGAPKWMDTDRYDIVAKAPAAAVLSNGPQNGRGAGPPVDLDTLLGMVRQLITERFQMKYHMEDRPVLAYTLSAVKPKLKPADPASRTKFSEGPASDAKDPRNTTPSRSRLVTVQNMTMAQFAAKLQDIAPGYIHSPVLDATGLEGSFDFTINFSPIGLAQGEGRGGGGAPAAPSSEVMAASDPNGAITLFEAIDKQLGLKLEQRKRPVPVMVIDHIEPKPIDN